MPELKDAKRERFCQEYVQDHNKTKAAIRAGYAERSARNRGHDLMQDPEVQERVRELDANITEHLGLTAAWVVSRWMRIADRAMQAKEIKEIDPETGDVVIVGYQFDGQTANRALENLAEYLHLMDDKITIEASGKKIRVTLEND